MKAALSVALVLSCQAALWAAESAGTAYGALRVIGKQSGADTLNRVVEVRGRFGAPEPETWKVTLDEPSARGGLREVEVQRGQITGEKTPVARSVGPKMNFSELNLDSEGAFTVVNQEMQKAAIIFDRVDYVLRSGGEGGKPIWHVDLFAGGNGRVGDFEIAADSGNILKKDLVRKQLKPIAPVAPVVPEDRAYVQTPPVDPVPPRRVSPDDRRYADDPRRLPDDPRRSPDGRYADEPRDPRAYPDDARRPYDDDDYVYDPTPFVDKVGRHFEKRSRQFKNFFSGHGWTDR